MGEIILTISVAAYNCEKYISKTLDSLCDKSVLPYIEVFVIDDGGKDRTLEIAKDYSENYGNSIIPVHKTNGGWGSTVNYSIQHARGKYFKLLDGDDYFNTEGLKQLIDVLKKTTADVVYTSYRRFDDATGKTIAHFRALDTLERNTILPITELFGNIDFKMHSTTFRTEFLRNAGISIQEHCFYTDTEYVAKGMVNSNTVMLTDIEVYEYRDGREGQSVDVSGLAKHYKDVYRVLDELLSLRKSVVESKKVIIDRYITSIARFQYLALLLLNHQKEYIEFDKQVRTYEIDCEDYRFDLIRKSEYRLFGVIGKWIVIKRRLASWIRKHK